MSDTDPFDEGVPRDGRGRPLIIPATRAGKPNLKAKPVAYTRASTFASALDDGKGLTRWTARHAVIGVACSPDLAAMVGALGRNLNAYSDQDMSRPVPRSCRRAIAPPCCPPRPA